MDSASIVYIPYAKEKESLNLLRTVVVKKIGKGGSALTLPGAAPTRPVLALTSPSTYKWPSQSSCSTTSPAKKEDLEAMAGALSPEVRVSNLHGMGIQRQPTRPHSARSCKRG
jgi:hypothetical protein